jgi:ribA/ribD-fused uncharacterized protein
MVQDKLYINSQKYTIDTLDLLPKPLAGDSPALRQTEENIFFWGKKATLSNFNDEYPIQVGQKHYNCIEQYYCAEKARFFGDSDAEKIIEQEPDPAKQKSTKVRNYNHEQWLQKAESVMRHAIQLKVDQNNDFKNYLIDTRPKFLCEASPTDKFWGAGLNIYDKRINQRSNWGKNKLGEILMSIRDNI